MNNPSATREPGSNLILLKQCLKVSLPKGMKTAWWLLKITIPVSFGVLLLDYYGVLYWMASYTKPLFRLVGLPGVSAIVLITSVFTNVYSVVAVLTTLHLPIREGMIIAGMCLVSHGFLIETAVLRKTGSSIPKMIALRLITSFVFAGILNLILPGHSSGEFLAGNHNMGSLNVVLVNWLHDISITTIKILILVNGLLFLQQVMEEFGWIKWLERPMAPVLRIMGLPRQASLSWIVANLIGLAYGSAIMISMVEEGKLKKADADLLNHHIAISHSELEDPLLFLTLGYTILWLIWPRLILAILSVWLRRLEIYLRNKRSAGRTLETIIDI